ncbi:DUF3486 family protein [Salinicola sp. JS01]|uniref:DUF3486 family protein n=1 Tax=Salinicola sp. JS01 TaxID=3050071 RepID=UPI00255B6789|nr:DUF3486 family protein [Salinicola sp. JS01]WIX31238.1 DUF3486 family protein [Salinicola sp. JS01]
MARRSSVTKLDPRIRESVDRAIREGRATIDDIVDQLDGIMGEDAPSRSAVGRYVKGAREQMQRYREAQEMAKVWVGKLEDDPNSDIGRLLSEMLRTVAFQQLATAGDEDAEVSTKDVAFLAGALKDLASADKVSMERELKIRSEVAKAAAARAEKAARRQGISNEGVASLRAAIMEGMK